MVREYSSLKKEGCRPCACGVNNELLIYNIKRSGLEFGKHKQ